MLYLGEYPTPVLPLQNALHNNCAPLCNISEYFSIIFPLILLFNMYFSINFIFGLHPLIPIIHH